MASLTAAARGRLLLRAAAPKPRFASSCGKYDYDLFTIGAGSGGVRGSRIAASHGATVGVADDLDVGLGGTCVNVGCVPKKLFAYGAEASTEMRDAYGFGWNFKNKYPNPDWKRLITNKNNEIARLNGIYEKMLKNTGVDVYKTRAELTGPNSVMVDGKEISAGKILIAVGGWPTMPKIPGSEYMISSNEAFYLKSPPKQAVMIGSGYISVEFAGIFKGYGAKVDLCIRRDRILGGFDEDIARYLQEQMVNQGINVRPKTQVTAIRPDENKEGWFQVNLSDGGTICADVIMAAIGRKPKVSGLGLEKAGVEVDTNGFIKVDRYYKTTAESVFAVGDCTDTLQLTPVALAQGHCFADTQFGGMERFADCEDVATAVFSHPNLGTVGLTEAQAEAKYGRIQVFKSEFRPLKHTISGSTERSLMKIIVDQKSDRVVGMHMVGAHAGEMMQGFAAALKLNITKKQLDTVIGIHPTSAEEFVTMRTMSYEKGGPE